jgi:WXG100 family type VII secretion target
MAQTQATPEEMHAAAAKFEQVNESLQQTLSSLMSKLEVLQTAWKGHGGQSFHTLKEQWAQDQKAISQALDDTAKAIRESGRNYTTTDSDAAGRLNTIAGSGLSLPL